MPRQLPAALRELADAQQDVLSTRQLGRTVSRDAVRAQLDAGRWRAAHRGVVLLHNGPATQEQATWAALLAAAPGAVIGGLTAARLDGLTGFEGLDGRIHLVLPHGQRRLVRPDVVVHWSGQLGEDDVHPARTPPRTRPARSLVDAASWSPGPRWARALVIAGVQQRLLRPDDLRDALARRGRCRHRVVIVESILDAEGGIASVPERDFALLVRRAGLPEPTRQRVLRGRDGSYYLDADWDAHGVSAEVHGVHHRGQWEQDLARHNEITAGGRRVLHFTSYAVRHDGADVERLLRRAVLLK